MRALRGALEQPGELTPAKHRSVFLRQVFLDQDPDVGERRQLHDVRNSDRARQWPRPVRGGQGTDLTLNVTYRTGYRRSPKGVESGCGRPAECQLSIRKTRFRLRESIKLR
jgi:hypothetical protein